MRKKKRTKQYNDQSAERALSLVYETVIREYEYDSNLSNSFDSRAGIMLSACIVVFTLIIPTIKFDILLSITLEHSAFIVIGYTLSSVICIGSFVYSFICLILALLPRQGNRMDVSGFGTDEWYMADAQSYRKRVIEALTGIIKNKDSQTHKKSIQYKNGTIGLMISVLAFALLYIFQIQL